MDLEEHGLKVAPHMNIQIYKYIYKEINAFEKGTTIPTEPYTTKYNPYLVK
jgi:hypothetical protein